MPKMKLRDYLDGMKNAQTAEELEAAINCGFKHSFSGPTWSRICNVRIKESQRICDAHPHGFYIPRFGPRRKFTVCGETMGVGVGHNGAGVRYVWHGANSWATAVLTANGISRKAAYKILDWCHEYPHRAIKVVDDALAGKIPDPEMDVLIKGKRYSTSRPINLTVEQNKADTIDRRATRPCECGGTLFDWGGGSSHGFQYINWRCNKCPDTFDEFMTSQRLCEIRNQKAA